MSTVDFSSTKPTQLDHGPGALSTEAGGEAARASELANAPRYRPAGSATEGLARGHVESHFLKANSPDGQRAVWVKHTLLVPTHPGAQPVAELWAIAFERGGAHKHALKQTYPLAAAQLSSAPFSFALPDATLTQGGARGSLGARGTGLSWDLRYDASGAPFRPFRFERMYSGGFPRSKSLTPVPDTRVFGQFDVAGESWQLAGWRGAQGHNWGVSHAHAYAWVHCNALRRDEDDRELSQTWVELLSGRVRVGPVVTPWLSVGGLCLEGRLFRFDGARAILSRQIAVDTGSYAFSLSQAGATLRGELSAEPSHVAGLRYEDPDGQLLSCLNSKLASGKLTLSYEGRTVLLHTSQAALEIGTRRTDHGIALLA